MKQGHAVPKDVCRKAIRAYERGGSSMAKVAARYDISDETLRRLLIQKNTTGDFGADPNFRRGPAFRLNEQDLEQLKELALANPALTREALCALAKQKLGKSFCEATMVKALRKVGVSKRGTYQPRTKKEANKITVNTDKEEKNEPRKYNVPKRERIRYPSDMTDLEWDTIKYFFEKEGNKGRPVTVSKREIVNAIFYMARSGCQWDMLPNDLPNDRTVNTYFNEWTKSGLWEKICDRLKKNTEVRSEEKNSQAREAWTVSQRRQRKTEAQKESTEQKR